ncbi:MAG: tRNA (N6-isopentenyl adenosine(37)-C2)-methylthiotransferase MiaB [Planctomycetota bacterium]
MGHSTYHLETFGCQMNVLDSQLVEGQLRALGLRPVDDHKAADVILFNTCSVRQHAEDKVLSRLGRLKSLKRQRPEVVIGVLGCMAERIKERLFDDLPHVDLLCGPGELHRLPELLHTVRQAGGHVAALTGKKARRSQTAPDVGPPDDLEALDCARQPGPLDNVLQSYVRVQRGCDKFCSYCVVPFVRGPEQSRTPDHIITEVRTLAEHGCREVTLLGQTVNSYHYELGGQPVRFAQLLERVHHVAEIDRIRFVTSFPADWDEDIFRVMRDYPRVMPYLHIPAQSGSDPILKAMRRGYTVAEYLRLMDTARRFVPDIALAGDFIVGFPGETEADYAATVELVRRVEYKSIFVFKYSPRPGTLADSAQPDDIPAEIKIQRNNDLLKVQERISLRQKQALVGQSVEVLVEGRSKAAHKHARQLVGRTPGDLIAVFDGDPDHVGSLVNVHIESVSPLTLFGCIESVVSPPRPGPPGHDPAPPLSAVG